ncbi:MAG: DUF4280 domain-containing protein [Aequorivita sp.]
MSEKHIVVQGAICECMQGFVPDMLKVESHKYEYANDKDGSQKLIGSTMELGQPFQNKTFGQCKLQPMGNSYKPCQPAITGWKDFYKDVTLKNGGNILTEDSQGICAIAGSPVVKFTNHGQIAQPSSQNMKNADEDTQAQLNPMVDPSDIGENEAKEEGLVESGN